MSDAQIRGPFGAGPHTSYPIAPSRESGNFALPSLMDQFLAACERGSKQPMNPRTASYSNYTAPIDSSPGRLQGYSREHGAASSQTQMEVMQMILDASQDLSTEDQALLLAIARVESGFNPDAAAKTTSASGVFQFINSTGRAFGLDDSNRFDARANIEAGVKLFKENLRLLEKKFPHLEGTDRAVMLYALHHDGPSLKYGGAEIAKQKVLPYLDRFTQIAEGFRESGVKETAPRGVIPPATELPRPDVAWVSRVHPQRT